MPRGNSLLKDVIEKTEKGTGKRGRIRVKLVDDLKVGKGYSGIKRKAMDREEWGRQNRNKK